MQGSNNRVGQITNRQRPGRAPVQVQNTSNQSSVQNLRNQANDLRQSIRPNANQASSSQSQPGFTARPSSNDISSNQPQPNTGNNTSQRETQTVSNFLKDTQTYPRQDHDSKFPRRFKPHPGISLDERRKYILNGNEAHQHNSFISKEKMAISDKINNYQSKINEINNKENRNYKDIRLKMKYEAVLEFLEIRENAWEKKSQHQFQAGDDSYSANKAAFYNSNITGLEHLIEKELMSSDYSYGFRPNQELIELTNKLGLVEHAQEFWVKENSFWNEEAKMEYRTEDKEVIDNIYDRIDDLQIAYEKTLLGETHYDLAAVRLAIITTKSELKPYQTNFSDDGHQYLPYDIDTEGKIHPYEELAFAIFKQAFFEAQESGLNQIRSDWQQVEETEFSKQQLKEIEESIEANKLAQEFWQGREGFWQELGDAGHSSSNREEVDAKLLELAELERDMDKSIYEDQNSSTGMNRRAAIQSQINTVEAEIRALHTRI